MPPPRGPWTELHHAVCDSVERTAAALSTGEIDVDQANMQGQTPLMLAVFQGHARMVGLLLNKGASVSRVEDDGYTALHVSAQQGHPAVTKLLVEAGADLEARGSTAGCTPLGIAADRGHSEVMSILIEAGANPNHCRISEGVTPLYSAADNGHVDAVKLLLRAKANPLLVARPSLDSTAVPLDVAAQNGHLGVVRELIRERGIKGCGGASGGVDALAVAVHEKQVEIMEILTNAGVVDTGLALLAAAEIGFESAVKFLLRQMKWTTRGERAAYLNTLGRTGQTPLFAAILKTSFSSARIVRLLVDAGADAKSPVLLGPKEGEVFFYDTALALVTRFLPNKGNEGDQTSTEEERNSLEASRRLLLRLEAVHATSWLWTRGTRGAASSALAAAGGGATRSQMIPVISMLSILRQRARRPRVLLAAVFRWAGVDEGKLGVCSWKRWMMSWRLLVAEAVYCCCHRPIALCSGRHFLLYRIPFR